MNFAAFTLFSKLPLTLSHSLCRRSLFLLPLEWEREILLFCQSLSNEPLSTTFLASLRLLCPLETFTFSVLGCKFLLTPFVVIPFTHLDSICPIHLGIQCSCGGFNWTAVAVDQHLASLRKTAIRGELYIMSNVVIVAWMSGVSNCFSLGRSVLKMSHTTTVW